MMTRIIAATMVATLFTFYGVPEAEAKKRHRPKVKVVKKVVKVNPYPRYRYPKVRVPTYEHYSINLGPGLGFSYYERSYKKVRPRYPYYHTGYYPTYGYWY